MFKRRLLCIIVSIILGIIPVLQTVPAYAAENSVMAENLSLSIQMMQKEKDKFEKNGSAEYVSGLKIDDCILIDLEWIANKLGLLVEIIEVKQKNKEEMSYDIRKYQEGQEKVFANNSENRAICIRKAENIYLQFVLKEGSEKAFTYSPHLGEMVVDLGAKVTEQQGKIYVPFTMFLNLFDSCYILDEENVINLYPCETTVVDILHMTGLGDYYFDVIEDCRLSDLGMAAVAGYDNFYQKIKSLFQGVVHLDVNKLMKAMPNDKTIVSELLSKMLFTSSDNEFEEVANLSEINSNLGLLTTDFIELQVEDGAEETLNNTIRKWAEQRESRIQSTGFLSVDEALKFERQAAEDISREKMVQSNIESSCKKMSINSNLMNIEFCAFIKYMTLVSEINSTEIFYVDAVKEFINGYNELPYSYMEKPIINVIEEKAKIYEKKEKNPFKNKELVKEIFKEIENTTTSLVLDDFAHYSAKQIATTHSSFKVNEFFKTWWQLQAVSVGWDIAELVVNEVTKGSLESLNGFHTALYAMLLQTDAYNVLKSIDNYQDLDEYRKLEWVRLRSHYITRQLMLMFYQPQQLLHPKEYEIAIKPIENECNELVELMTVLAVGSGGISQEKLDGLSEMRSELDGEILKGIERQENTLIKDDTELIPEEKASDLEEWKIAYINFINEKGKVYNSLTASYVDEYKLVNIDNDSIPELYINLGSVAAGDWICSYYNDSIICQHMYNYGFAYIEGENLFIDSGGRMDTYYDVVYSIENGVFSIVGSGDYGAVDNSNVQYDETGYPIYDYYWNGNKLTNENEYVKLLSEIFDRSQAITPYDGGEYDFQTRRYIGNGICGYQEIIREIEEY